MTDESPLSSLATHFLALSLFAVGGANAVIPEMHRQAVETAGWMTERQFADVFAISQVAPGPNIIIVTLLGFHVAGVLGGLVATLAMCGPSCLLTYVVERSLTSFGSARVISILQAGLVPISVGLIAASALIVAGSAATSMGATAMIVATALVAFFTRIHPLWMFALAAAFGYVGLI
jgi:chromate transporter